MSRPRRSMWSDDALTRTRIEDQEQRILISLDGTPHKISPPVEVFLLIIAPTYRIRRDGLMVRLSQLFLDALTLLDDYQQPTHVLLCVTPDEAPLNSLRVNRSAVIVLSVRSPSWSTSTSLRIHSVRGAWITRHILDLHGRSVTST